MDGSIPAIAAGVIGVLLTGLFSYITQRAAGKAAVRSTQLTSRTEVEKDAFSRAEDYYQGVIEDQNRRYGSLQADLSACNDDKVKLRTRTVVLQTEMEALSVDLTGCKDTVRRLMRQ